jgi:hypothetical protein
MEPLHSCADLMPWLSDFFTSFLHVKRPYLDNTLILKELFLGMVYALNAGLIPFRFIAGALTPVTLDNTGAGNGNPSDASGLPGYMLGVDPYLATGTFQTEGTAVYAALSDRSRVGGLDHDYSDMGVRVSVHEPGTVFLLGSGWMELASNLRRRKV